MTKLLIPSLALASLLTLGSGVPALAQGDSGALLDILVRKKVLSAQEAEEVRADLIKENAVTSAGKLSISNSVTEMKLSGDLRLRYQYDNKDSQLVQTSGAQRSRERFRLRLNADFKLAENFFGGVQLQTSSAADSGNQTFSGAYANYGIYISRAYLGWSPADWLTVTGGKVPNPFYTTDLVWDSDINPDGLTQSIAFHKLFNGVRSEQVSGFSKDGKEIVSSSTIRSDVPWELTLNLGQFIYQDNNEDLFRNDGSTDAWHFVGQLVFGYRFTPDVKLTFAPGYMTYTAADITSVNNENPFIAFGGTRNLSIITAPGDLSFKVAGIKTKFLWDFAYNTEGSQRTRNIYGLTGPTTANNFAPISDHSSQDDLAFLLGLQLGENKKKGDWSLFANYRQTGIAAVDPNLNDSDFALGELNTRGFKVGGAYNFTDFIVGAITYFDASNLREVLVGGQATGGNALADANAVNILQVDLNVKF